MESATQEALVLSAKLSGSRSRPPGAELWLTLLPGHGGPGKGAWWEFWQQGRKLPVRCGRKPSGGGWGILGPEGEAFLLPSLAHQAPGSAATRRTPEAARALAQALLEFSCGVPQLSPMERQGEASFCILERSYQNPRSQDKVSPPEARAKRRKPGLLWRQLLKGP